MNKPGEVRLENVWKSFRDGRDVTESQSIRLEIRSPQPLLSAFGFARGMQDESEVRSNEAGVSRVPRLFEQFERTATEPVEVGGVTVGVANGGRLTLARLPAHGFRPGCQLSIVRRLWLGGGREDEKALPVRGYVVVAIQQMVPNRDRDRRP